MSGWMPSLGGGKWFQPHPTEKILYDAARVNHQEEYAYVAPAQAYSPPVVLPPASSATPPPAPTSASSKAKTVAGVGLGILGAEETVRRLHDSPVVHKVVTFASNVPEMAQNATSATINKAKEAAGSAFETASSFCSWSTFGLGFMSYMPYSVQYLVGGAGAIASLYGLSFLIGLCRSCRHPNGQATHNTIRSDLNLHFHGIPENCKPVAKTQVHADGSKDMHVELVCEAPRVATAPQQNKPQQTVPVKEVAKELNPVGLIAVPAMKMIPTAKAYHLRLNAIVANNLGALSKPVQKQVKGLNLHFNKLAERKYVAKSLGTDLAKARLLLDDVDKLIATATKTVGAMELSKKRNIEVQSKESPKKAKADSKASK